MQSVKNWLNWLYVEFVGLLFRLFGPKQTDHIISAPELPEEPEQEQEQEQEQETAPADFPKMGIWGLTTKVGWD